MEEYTESLPVHSRQLRRILAQRLESRRARPMPMRRVARLTKIKVESRGIDSGILAATDYRYAFNCKGKPESRRQVVESNHFEESDWHILGRSIGYLLRPTNAESSS